MFDIVSVIYVSVISRKLWKKTIKSSRSLGGVLIQLGDRPHIMYVGRRTISALSLHGEDTTSSLPAAWTSIDNPWRIGISHDGGSGVVTHGTYDSGYQVTLLILESGVWRRNTTYQLICPGIYNQPVTITQSGEVITGVSMAIYMCYYIPLSNYQLHHGMQSFRIHRLLHACRLLHDC